MKTMTATVAVFAAALTVQAAPAMAESTAYEQRAKLERLLNPHKVEAPKTVTKDRVVSTRMLTGPEKAHARLLRVQPDAARGGR